jgi:hypothetical protein
MHRGFWWGNLRESDRLEDIDMDGRIILKWIVKMQSGGCGDWIDLTKNRRR